MTPTPENIANVYTRMGEALGGQTGYPNEFMARQYARLICCLVRDAETDLKRRVMVDETLEIECRRCTGIGPVEDIGYGCPQCRGTGTERVRLPVEKLRTVQRVNDLDHLLVLIGGQKWWPSLAEVYDLYPFAPDTEHDAEAQAMCGMVMR